jgi:hypothetical protein
MQRSGMHRVGVAKLYYLQFFSLKVESIAFEDLRRYQGRRNLSRKSRLPEGFDEVRDLVCFCMDAIEEAVANALALGNLSRTSFSPKKWSPWAWVT